MDDPEDLPAKLAKLEKALVDRDLLLLRQNEDIASLEDQLSRVISNSADGPCHCTLVKHDGRRSIYPSFH